MAVSVLCLATSLSAQITKQDTTGPNGYSLSGDVVVSEDGSNAMVEVYFQPGNRGWSGAVRYYTENGTATAGQDYIGTNGIVYFNGPSPRWITVPILEDSENEGEETIRLCLVIEGYSYTSKSNAVIRIVNSRPKPKLQILSQANGSLKLCWNDDGSMPVLEKSSLPLSSNWITVTNAPTVVNGTCSVVENCAGQSAFYRLRKAE